MKILAAVLVLILSFPVFANEPVSLELLKWTKKYSNGFKRDENNSFWKMEAPTEIPDDYYCSYTFPYKCTVMKIEVVCEEKIIPEFSSDPVPSMYNFDIYIRKPKAKDWTLFRKVRRNSENHYTIDERVVCEAVKLKVASMPSAVGGKDIYYAEYKRFVVTGFEGDVLPKQEKIFDYPDEIKTKDDAKKAFNNKEITAEEYIKLLKELPE